MQRINKALENNKYCSAAFLDISQAFDKVWHTGLLYQLRWSLPLRMKANESKLVHVTHTLHKEKRAHRSI
jgi:hypothetical protein